MYKIKDNNTLVAEIFFANSLWEIWSVPPIVGEIPFFILWEITIDESNKGIIKNNNKGLINDVYIVFSTGVQLNKMLIKPKQYPINKLPESPRYNLAGG